jgi:hypothetical protein
MYRNGICVACGGNAHRRGRTRAGTSGVVAYTWNGIFLPMRDKQGSFGAEIVSDVDSTPQHLGELVKSEIAKWAAPIKASGVTVE